MPHAQVSMLIFVRRVRGIAVARLGKLEAKRICNTFLQAGSFQDCLFNLCRRYLILAIIKQYVLKSFAISLVLANFMQLSISQIPEEPRCHYTLFYLISRMLLHHDRVSISCAEVPGELSGRRMLLDLRQNLVV